MSQRSTEIFTNNKQISDDNPFSVKQAPPPEGVFQVYEDALFTTGESPRDLDVNTDLGRNGANLMMRNDGPGDISIQVSADGTAFSDVWTLRTQEIMELQIDIDTIRLTWIADAGYRIMVI